MIFLLISTPILAQSTDTITISKEKLTALITEAVTREVDKAVSEAVSLAVKETETKYILQIADLKKEIADKDGEIAKNKVLIEELNIQLENAAIKYNNYVKTHGLKQDLILGGITFISAIAIDELLRIWIKSQLY